jgi:hypothetical protein
MSNGAAGKIGDLGNSVPSWTAEVGIRFGRVVALYPTRRAAAQICGKSEDMLSRYEKALSDPPFSVIAFLAIQKGVSLSWIFDGRGSMMADAPPAPTTLPIDSALLTLVVAVVEGALVQRGRTLDALQKGEAIATLYELAAEQPEGERAGWVKGTGAKVLRLVK